MRQINQIKSGKGVYGKGATRLIFGRRPGDTIVGMVTENTVTQMILYGSKDSIYSPATRLRFCFLATTHSRLCDARKFVRSGEMLSATHENEISYEPYALFGNVTSHHTCYTSCLQCLSTTHIEHNTKHSAHLRRSIRFLLSVKLINKSLLRDHSIHTDFYTAHEKNSRGGRHGGTRELDSRLRQASSDTCCLKEVEKGN